MLRSARRRAAPITQRMASDVRRSGRTSTGTWYVEPPTRRDFTSTAGFTLSMAVLNIFKASCLLRSSMAVSASYMMRSAVDFLPRIIMMLTNFATSRDPYFGSGKTSRLAAPARRISCLRPSAPWRRTYLGGGVRPPSAPPPDRLPRQSRRSNDEGAASAASALRRLGAVLRATLLASRHPGRVERAADDVIADTRQVFHATAADHHDRVLLQVVSDTGDVRRDLQPVREPHPRHLAEGGVRLLRCGRVDADAHAPLLRARLHRGRLRLLTHRFPAVANELINRRHGSPSPFTATKLSRYTRASCLCQSPSVFNQAHLARSGDRAVALRRIR